MNAATITTALVENMYKMADSVWRKLFMCVFQARQSIAISVVEDIFSYTVVLGISLGNVSLNFESGKFSSF
jgi:hypothetical protein